MAGSSKCLRVSEESLNSSCLRSPSPIRCPKESGDDTYIVLAVQLTRPRTATVLAVQNPPVRIMCCSMLSCGIKVTGRYLSSSSHISWLRYPCSSVAAQLYVVRAYRVPHSSLFLSYTYSIQQSRWFADGLHVHLIWITCSRLRKEILVERCAWIESMAIQNLIPIWLCDQNKVLQVEIEPYRSQTTRITHHASHHATASTSAQKI